jgi:hypothetical protein
LREMFRVYETREDIVDPQDMSNVSFEIGPDVCMRRIEYYGLITTLIVITKSYNRQFLNCCIKIVAVQLSIRLNTREGRLNISGECQHA